MTTIESGLETRQFADRRQARRALAGLCVADLIDRAVEITPSEAEDSAHQGRYADFARQIFAALEENDERYGGLSKMLYEFGLQEMLLMVERSAEAYIAHCSTAGTEPSIEELEAALLAGDVHTKFMALKVGPAKTFETHYGMRDTEGTTKTMNFVFREVEGGLMYTVDEVDWLMCSGEAGWDVNATGEQLCAAYGTFGNNLWEAVVRHAATDPGLLKADLEKLKG